MLDAVRSDAIGIKDCCLLPLKVIADTSTEASTCHNFSDHRYTGMTD